MSLLCGVISLDDRSVDRYELDDMVKPMVSNKHAKARLCVNQNIAVASICLNQSGRTDVSQPAWISDGRLWVFADARIDALDELTSRLQARIKGENVVELLLAAYKKFGNRCFEYILGDFVIVIWDSSNHSIVAARDRSGYRSLYYRLDKNNFYFSSKIQSLTVQDGFNRKLNRKLAAKDLILPAYGGRDETYFKGIHKLRNAHYVLVKDRKLSKHKYWFPESTLQISYKDEAEYSEHFAQIFNSCVRDRLTGNSLGLCLSSGLDSGTLAAVACEQLSQKSVSSTSLLGVNWTYGHNPELNENHGSRALAKRYKFRYHEIDISKTGILDSLIADKLNFNDPYCSHMLPAFVQTLEKFAGSAETWMTGYFADYLVGGLDSRFYFNKSYLKQPISQWWTILHNHGQQFAQMKRGRFLWAILKYEHRKKIMVARLHINRARRRKYASIQHWVNRDLIAEFPELVDWIRSQDIRYGWAGFGGDDMSHRKWMLLNFNRPVRTREWLSDLGAQFGVQMHSPWDDARLIEFILSLPLSVLNRGMIEKDIVRKAYRSSLPDEFYSKTRKHPGFGRNLNNNIIKFGKTPIESTLSNMCAHELGLVDQKVLKNCYMDIYNGEKKWRFDLLMPFSLESWIRKNKI